MTSDTMNEVGVLKTQGHAKTQIGNNYSIEVRNSINPTKNQCLADLRLTDPRDDKARIEQTKGGLLKGLYKWIFHHVDFQRWHDDKQSRLLWVQGDPGKGKTMLLCGMIDELSHRLRELSRDTSKRDIMEWPPWQSKKPSNTLLSFFFCQGTDPRLNNATAVLRGLIYLLLDQQETLTLHLWKRYNHAHRLFDDTNAFYTLSQVLVDILCDPNLRSAYLIIDGLDECQAGLPELLDFIVRTSKSHRVKWIVSSRYRHDIEQRLYLNDSLISLSLERNAEHVSQAVDAYIDCKLSRLASLKDNQTLRDQVRHQMRRKANGTFLWAALVIQELQKVRLDVLRVVEEIPAGLTFLYDRMAKQIQQLDCQEYEYCRLVLSTVALSFRPLHLQELGILSGLPERIVSSITTIVEMCGSFLTIRNDYIYFIHHSAKDYLSTHAPAAIFPLGYQEVHHRIFSQSLKVMSILRQDIYDLRHPGVSVDQATKVRPNPDPLDTVRYACVYWVDHLSELNIYSSPYRSILRYNGNVHVFLQEFFLYWFEALSLMGRMSDGVAATAKLVELLKGVSSEPQVLKLVQDACRFILLNRSIVENTPLQIYASALVFNPAYNLIKEVFRKEEPRWIAIKPIVEIGHHADSVNAVVFSHDSQQLASASDDNTVRVWEVETGYCLHTFKGHTGSVRSVAFSHDSRWLASASDDKTIRLWGIKTGNCLQIFEGHIGSAKSVAFSHDSRWLASASDDKTIQLWDTKNGNCLKIFEGHTGSVRSITFSHDSRLLASASVDKTIRLWDTKSSNCLQIFKGRKSFVRVWDDETGCWLKIFKDHTYSARSIAFSHDSRRLASASNDTTVRIWDTKTGKCLQTLHVGTSLHSISFYHNDSCLLTDLGLLILDVSISSATIAAITAPAAAVPREPRREGYGLSSNRSWVTWHGQNVLWLPSGYRPLSSAIVEHAIAFGCSSGRVLVMMFSPTMSPTEFRMAG